MEIIPLASGKIERLEQVLMHSFEPNHNTEPTLKEIQIMVSRHIIRSHRVCPYLVGGRSGHLVVLKHAGVRICNGQPRQYWLCLCDCGNTKAIRADALYTYGIKSCGCLLHETPPAEIRQRISRTKKSNPTRYWLGKKRHPETNNKISLTKLANGDSVGSKNAAWNGGVSRIGYPYIFNKALKRQIRERDNFTCVLCGRTEDAEQAEFRRVLSVNHIDFDKSNCDPDNLNTLCLRCNTSVNADREKWTTHFQSQRATNAA